MTHLIQDELYIVNNNYDHYIGQAIDKQTLKIIKILENHVCTSCTVGGIWNIQYYKKHDIKLLTNLDKIKYL